MSAAACCSTAYHVRVHRHLESPMTTTRLWAGDHVGRDFTGTRLEAGCPCPKAACGLVYADRIRSDCPIHAAARSMRQSHPTRNCPGGTT